MNLLDGQAREALASARLETCTLDPPGTIRFTVYGQPKTAGSKRAFYKAGMKHARVVEDNEKSREWKGAVADAAAQAYCLPLLDGAIRLTLTFFRPRPKGHYGKSGVRASADKYPTTKPDVLKLARAVEDAITGVIWRDDAQIVVEVLAKEFGEPARVEIEIQPL